MKLLKRLGIAVLALPIVLAVLWGLYEVFGMCVNHIATGQQTYALQANLEREIPDVEIVGVFSETGNTSGTGNHVDCLSSITFSTEMREAEIEDRMSKYYAFEEGNCYVDPTADGHYVICVNTSAPFADNIEGH